jgi:hypothetical protein
MSRNLFNYEVTDINALQKFASNAVEVIPEKKKPIRSQITNMLKAGIKLEQHGIRIIDNAE